jgi:Domain of unknown function (DUF4465)
MIKSIQLLLLIAASALSLHAQTTSDFESTAFGANAYLDNAGAAGAFANGNVALVNRYDAAFMAWEGWALSKVTDNTTQGFGNQYSCIAGKGAANSQVYAVGYAFNPSIVRLTGAATGKLVQGMFINNNTYAYYTMLLGDAFSKRFGGATGTDPDYFLLTIKGFRNGSITADSVNFYLADYRFANSAQDYVVKDWSFVNLSSLGNVDSLAFGLTSTDVGAFGMNTPAYFCMDRITTLDGNVDAEEVTTVPSDLHLYPNPARSVVYIDGVGTGADFTLFDFTGRVVRSGSLTAMGVPLDGLAPGGYVMRCGGGNYKLLITNY